MATARIWWLLVLVLAGCTAAQDITPSPELLLARHPEKLESPTSSLPAAGICAESDEPFALIVLAVDTPNPRCMKVHGDQQLRVANATGKRVTVTFLGRRYALEVGADRAFAPALGEVWEPGVHHLPTSAYGGSSGPAIWLVAD
jgi:hypothetical protein